MRHGKVTPSLKRARQALSGRFSPVRRAGLGENKAAFTNRIMSFNAGGSRRGKRAALKKVVLNRVFNSFHRVINRGREILSGIRWKQIGGLAGKFSQNTEKPRGILYISAKEKNRMIHFVEWNMQEIFRGGDRAGSRHRYDTTAGQKRKARRESGRIQTRILPNLWFVV